MLFSLSVYGADWPFWRGPNGNGISTESKWNPLTLKKGAKILWKKRLGKGYSSVSIKDGLLYTMGYKNKKNTIYCLNAITGKEVWKYTYSCGKGEYTGPKSTPVIDGSVVYTLSQEGHLFCHDAKKNKVIWEKNIVDDLGATILRWNFASSPVIKGELLYINAGKSGMALNKKTGKKIWSSVPGVGNYSSAEIFNMDNKLYAAIFGEEDLFLVDALNGKVKWSLPWKTEYDVNAADPIYFDKKLFISSGYEKGCALIDISKGKPDVIWQNKNMSTHFQTCVLINNYLYGVSGNAGEGVLKCIDVKTGKVKWEKETGFGSVIAVNEYLIVLNEKGTLRIVKINPDKYIEVSKSKKLLSRLCWTPPVLANGLIYCRNDKGNLICIDARK